ncbi:MAG: hypothetical protein GVY20_01045 [Bacteroidetes bacterium]|nr:hypothetical protein [Bacteroidota bacterium]
MKNSVSPHDRLNKKLQERISEHRNNTFNLIDSFESSHFINIEGKNPLNFSSNVFLNLSNQKLQKERRIKFTQKFGAITSSSTETVINALINYFSGFSDYNAPPLLILGSAHQETDCTKLVELL